MAFKREKMEESIRRKVADLLIKDIKDPRIGYVTVTGVEINKDYSVARVGISIFGNAREARKSLQGIKSSAAYIQHRVAKALAMRYMPKLEFFLDSKVADSVDMVSFLEGLVPDKSEDENEIEESVEEKTDENNTNEDEK